MKPFVLPALVVLSSAMSLCAQEMVEHPPAAPVPADATLYHPGVQPVGQCCEPDVSYCESLWANYCHEKKHCRDTCSPRRSVCGHPACVGGCCGFPFKTECCRPAFCLPLPGCFGAHRFARPDCTSGGCCAGDASALDAGAATDASGLTAPIPEEETGSGVTSPEPADEDMAPPPAPEPPVEVEVPDLPAPAPPPEDSARRWFLPFLRVK
jgi:hypothetical protein